MREYVHLHRKALASWVFEDPRRWHFFSFLLMKADERGRVEVSVNDYAKKYGIDRSWLRRCINEMIDRNIIDQQTTNKRTIVTICKYEDYNTLTIDECAKSDQQTTNKPTSQEEKKEERERKFPPHPLIKKEKEEKREEAPLLLLNTHEECDFGEETSGDVIDTTRLDAEITALASSQQRMEVLAMREHLTVEEVRARLQEFRLECMAQGTLSHRNLEDTFRHFGNWIRIRLKNERQEHGSNRQNNEREQLMERMQGYAAVVAEFRSKRGTGKVRQPGEVPDDLPF